MDDTKKDTIRSVKITRRRALKQGRVAVEIEMTAEDWAWMEELEDRRMIPLPDMLYSGFFQGMEREGWKNPDWVTTPDEIPPSVRVGAMMRKPSKRSEKLHLSAL